MTEARTRNPARSKAAILEAARTAFSTRGYAQVGVREIAVAAGVATSLIDRHFGNKLQLFEAALLDALAPRQEWSGRATFGDYIHRILSKPDLNIQGLLMSILAAGDSDASAIAARLTEGRVIAPLAEWLGSPDGHLRAVRMNAIVVGYLIQTRFLTPGNQPEDERLLVGISAELQRLCTPDSSPGLELPGVP
ncbi:MAG: TetR/AcrR family transcriptional regulator [Novosphingobium sp.]|nr:MAG: TetR/AcrR family transcriptional regulator [Novosphingobium sp.]